MSEGRGYLLLVTVPGVREREGGGREGRREGGREGHRERGGGGRGGGALVVECVV